MEKDNINSDAENFSKFYMSLNDDERIKLYEFLNPTWVKFDPKTIKNMLRNNHLHVKTLNMIENPKDKIIMQDESTNTFMEFKDIQHYISDSKIRHEDPDCPNKHSEIVWNDGNHAIFFNLSKSVSDENAKVIGNMFLDFLNKKFVKKVELGVVVSKNSDTDIKEILITGCSVKNAEKRISIINEFVDSADKSTRVMIADSNDLENIPIDGYIKRTPH